ncbi:MAG: endonuclease [Eubacterium sp.]|nr:endonuclease [Eubacterium sp.]
MKKVLKVVGIVILILILAVVLLFAVLTITEFKPDDVEEAEISSGAESVPGSEDEITVMTWNIGYGALGDNADFFMDGGSSVMTADAARVNENMENIISEVDKIAPDIALFQEVDINSMRSHSIDEAELISASMTGTDTSFAYNYRCLFIPYPIPPIGYVNGGILTVSDYGIQEALRYQLPCPFSWPLRLGNLKRCVVVNRIELEDSDKELVVVNLHLEAYDSGEGKVAQTNMLKEILEEEAEKGNYVIAGGDFNQSFSNVDSSMYPYYEGMWEPGIIDEESFEGWQLIMDNSSPSCRSLDKAYEGADKDSFQYYIIDGFIVSENITVESVETKDLGFVSSDHNPVVMKVTLD